MGQVEIFQCHGADVIVIRYFVGVRVGVAVCVRPCIGFCAVAHFFHNGFRQDILLVEQRLQIASHLSNGKLPVMERRQNGDQHIGVMLDAVKVKVVLVIVMGGLVVVQICLQLGFQCSIGILGGQHIAVLGKVGGRRNAASGAAKHGGAGLQAGHNHQQQKPQHQNGQ